MPLDFEKINQNINDIDENIKEVREYAALPDKEFWEDKRNILAIKHLLLQAIETAGAICLHVSAHKLKKSAEGLADCFHNLYEAKIIDSTLYGGLKQMSKFRNKPVHHYQKIDDKEVLKYARKDLQDFEDFVAKIGKELEL